MHRRSTLFAACCLLLLTTGFMAAGFWQVARAQYKDRLQAEVLASAHEPAVHAGTDMLDASRVHLHRLEARGSWLPERGILLDNKVQDGVVGYEVVMPLRLEGSELYLLVNRGWIKAPQLRSELPKVETPLGLVLVEGIARVPNNRFLELGSDVVTGNVWQNLTIERYQQWAQLPLQPVVLYQDSGGTDGLLRVEAAPEASGLNADRHRGYAFTWFSLAAVTVILGFLGWRRSRAELDSTE